MRLRFGLWAPLALAAALTGAPVAAQPLPGSPPPRGIMPRQSDVMPGPAMGDAPGADMPGADPLQILTNSFQVQRDLGLTPHQVENLQLASRNFLTQMQALAARPGPPEQSRAAIDAEIAKTRPMINRELSSEQLGRFQQIMLQIQGPCVTAMDPQMAAQLGIVGRQQADVAAVCQDRSMQIRASFRPPAPGEDQCRGAARNQERLERIRADSDTRVLALFSPEQRAQFMRMEGRRIELEPPLPPGCAPGHP